MSDVEDTRGIPLDTNHAVDLAVAFGLAIVGMIAVLSLSITLVIAFGEDTLTVLELTVVSGLGYVLTAAGYLAISGRGVEYVDLGPPTRRLAGLGLAVGVAMVVAKVPISAVGIAVGVPELFGEGVRQAATSSTTVVTMIVLGFLVTAPAEELMFRNVIQKRLNVRFSTATAIVLASIAFTIPHVVNFTHESPITIVMGLVQVFVMSLIVGTAYARWQRLEIAILAHGVHNALILVIGYVYI